MSPASSIPSTGYLRLQQIIGTVAATQRKKKDRKTAAPFYTPIIPVSKSTWWAGVKSGRFPKPVKSLGQRISVWRAEDIRKLIDTASSDQ